MSVDNMDWREGLDLISKKYNVPPISNIPDMEEPPEDPPHNIVNITEMSDQELANAYFAASKWKAYCDFCVGLYAPGENFFAGALNRAKVKAYKTRYTNQGRKPSNVREGEIMVDSDPLVMEMSKAYGMMKGNHDYYKARGSEFTQLAMAFGNERKDRRERELRREMA